ncbi:hypothetical protein BaRGS_00039778 [Batillaria attramentaria]|uniref:Uncharacterized protein n=1 Tax=Batillaria attramentaria TaxID=370345 RepID=A0ABD0J2A3_9CAEN
MMRVKSTEEQLKRTLSTWEDTDFKPLYVGATQHPQERSLQHQDRFRNYTDLVMIEAPTDNNSGYTLVVTLVVRNCLSSN